MIRTIKLPDVPLEQIIHSSQAPELLNIAYLKIIAQLPPEIVGFLGIGMCSRGVRKTSHSDARRVQPILLSLGGCVNHGRWLNTLTYKLADRLEDEFQFTRCIGVVAMHCSSGYQVQKTVILTEYDGVVMSQRLLGQ